MLEPRAQAVVVWGALCIADMTLDCGHVIHLCLGYFFHHCCKVGCA